MDCKGTNALQGPKGPFSVLLECVHVEFDVVQRRADKCAELPPVEFSLDSCDCLKFGRSSISKPSMYMSMLFSKMNKRSGPVIKSFNLQPLVSLLQSKTAAAITQRIGGRRSHFHSPIKQSIKTQMPATDSTAGRHCAESMVTDFVQNLLCGGALCFPF